MRAHRPFPAECFFGAVAPPPLLIIQNDVGYMATAPRATAEGAARWPAFLIQVQPCN